MSGDINIDLRQRLPEDAGEYKALLDSLSTNRFKEIFLLLCDCGLESLLLESLDLDAPLSSLWLRMRALQYFLQQASSSRIN